MDKLLWWVLAGSRGGENRIRILLQLKRMPLNTNQISEELGLDYKTVQHHIRMLKKNRLITEEGDHYGRMYFLASWLEDKWSVVEDIMVKSGKNDK